MNISQLNCPSCKDQYTQINPPRFLTMCGHTFCHKCIKTLITKKKDKGFKIKCPIDKGSMEIEKPNPNLFPKNIVLIELLNKNNAEFTSNQFLNVSMMEKNVSNTEIDNYPSEQKLQDSFQSNEKIVSGNKKICEQHKKVMDVYCLQDFQIICTDCALFSNHRFHEIKNLSELLKLESQKVNELSMLLSSKKSVQEKFMNKEIQNQIFDLLDKKKALIDKEISQFFVEFRKMIDIKEMELKEDLEAKSLLIAERMRDKMKSQKLAIQKYQIWQEELLNIIHPEQNSSLEHVEKILQNFIKNGHYEEMIKDGQHIIEKMNKKQDEFISGFEETLNCFTFSQNFEDIQLVLESLKILCQTQTLKKPIQECQNFSKHSRSSSHNKFQNQNPVCLNQKIISQKLISSSGNFLTQNVRFTQEGQNQKEQYRSDDEEQSLLDFDTSFSVKPLGPSTLSCNNISVLSIYSSANEMKGKKEGVTSSKKNPVMQKKFGKQKKMQSSRVSHKSRAQSLSLSSVTVKSVTSAKKITSPKPNQADSRLKYQALIESISGNKIDTVDLTGAQPKPEELTLILSAIERSQSVITVKLMRNKLDDSFVQKYFKNLLSVERLNLAQNKFTQQAVDQALDVLKKNPNHKIQSLNMGQNRIVERKNRKVLQEFKKLSVNIVL